MDQIKATYDQLEDVATRFSVQAEAVQSMLQRVRSCFSQLEGGGWMGQGADAFISEMNSEIFPAYQKLIDILNESSACTKAISERFQMAEDDAVNLFRNI